MAIGAAAIMLLLALLSGVDVWGAILTAGFCGLTTLGTVGTLWAILRLFRRKKDQPARPTTEILRITGPGHFRGAIVGESHYQQALEAAAGSRSQRRRVQVEAALVPEDDNPHDPQAIRIEIGGRRVGYLSRDDARAWRRYLAGQGQAGARALCQAEISGGGQGRDGLKYLGVWLDLPPEAL